MCTRLKRQHVWKKKDLKPRSGRPTKAVSQLLSDGAILLRNRKGAITNSIETKKVEFDELVKELKENIPGELPADIELVRKKCVEEIERATAKLLKLADEIGSTQLDTHVQDASDANALRKQLLSIKKDEVVSAQREIVNAISAFRKALKQARGAHKKRIRLQHRLEI